MDWSNERYVRLYTRDTTTWKVMDWFGRATLMFLLRKVDRAGVLDVGEHGTQGVAAVLEVPLDVVDRGLPQLLQLGVVVQTAGRYVMPKFLEAQEAVQSDAMRAKEYRERRRAEALAGSDAAVTKRDAKPGKPSRNVTKKPKNVTPARPDQPSSPSLPSRPRLGERQSRAAEKNTAAASQAASPPGGWMPPADWPAARIARERVAAGELTDARIAASWRKFADGGRHLLRDAKQRAEKWIRDEHAVTNGARDDEPSDADYARAPWEI